MQDLLNKLSNTEALSDEARENIRVWLTRVDLSQYRAEITELLEAQEYQKLEDAFYTRIRVGTGGLRGTIGVGSNRINRRTIAEAAQGLSDFINDFGPESKEKGVVVGHEARKFSREFAEMCCEVFAANGIKSHIFDSLRATPEISFAVRHLGTIAGVQITASHNPRTDNGFKFYWSDGGQVVPPLDQKFMELVQQVDKIVYIPFADGVSSGMISIIGNEVDESYISAIRNLSLSSSRSATIVFSPIHGAGSKNVLPVLRKEGYTVEVVPEQAEPDDTFPTAKGDLINPEYREVMDLPIALAEKLDYDVAINSDPDADRIGVAAKMQLDSNRLQFLTGNEVGIALVGYVLEQLKRQGRLNENNLVLETYVTTSLISDIAKSYGVKVQDDLLVGFKFIGEIIEKLENKDDFIFAAEESLGYLAGTFVRDKDAAIAALLLAELVSQLKDDGKTLVGYLDSLYETHGYYKNILHMAELPGKKGFLNIDSIMRGFRENPPTKLAGYPVITVIDRLPEEKRSPEKYKVGATGDQLTYVLSNDHKSRVTVRPSGTEPKVKYYIQHFDKIDDGLESVRNTVNQQAQAITESVINYSEKFIR